jgi:hypothetical protein
MPFPRVSPENWSPKTRPHHSQGYLMFREVQRVLFNDLISPEITPRDFKQLARAWCVMEDRIRIMKMIPKIRGVDMSAIALARRLRRYERQQFSPPVASSV